MNALRRRSIAVAPAGSLIAALMATLVALSACGSGGSPGGPGSPPTTSTSATSTTTPATSASSTSASRSTAPSTTAGPPSLTASASAPIAGENLAPARLRALQSAVDDGSQPWRLDRVSVARAFVQGRFGWTGADYRAEGTQSVVVVDRANGRRLTLRLVQPVRSGPGGVWVVAEARTGAG